MYNHVDQSYRSRPIFMSEEVFRALVSRIRAYRDSNPDHLISVVFHGGEPMLFDPQVLDGWLNEAKEVLGTGVRFGMQTNASVVTDQWIDVLRRHQIQPGVSIDGPAEIHDLVRVDHAGKGTHSKTVQGLQRFLEADLKPGLLCVINPQYSGIEVYRHLRSLNVKRMNFLLPEVTHDSRRLFYGDLGPTPLADYLIPIFDDWWAEDDPDIRIKLFYEAIKMILGGAPNTDTLGNALEDYLIIDTDGSIQGNDCLKICFEGASETGLNVIEHSFDQLHRGNPFVYKLMHEGIPLCEKCLLCPERDVCGGGPVTQRYSHSTGFSNPSVWCEDLLKLLGHIRRAIAPTAISSYAMSKTSE
jgi:uncharacterized protein